jgi:hypothetical protein
MRFTGEQKPENKEKEKQQPNQIHTAHKTKCLLGLTNKVAFAALL